MPLIVLCIISTMLFVAAGTNIEEIVRDGVGKKPIIYLTINLVLGVYMLVTIIGKAAA